MFHLDHMALGVRELSEGVRRLRTESGFGVYDGGTFPGSGLGNWIVPLGGDVYVEVEGVAGAPQPPGPATDTAPSSAPSSGPSPAAPSSPSPSSEALADGSLPRWASSSPAEWFTRATRDGRDRWMFWCLRADTLEELEAVADRLGGEVARMPGRVEPDGHRRVITSAPGGSLTLDACWKRGLPNWYYREDPATHPARREVTGERTAQGVNWVEVGGDEAELRKHIGEEAFGSLPLRVVRGAPGLHAVSVRTADGEEVVIRREPVDAASF